MAAKLNRDDKTILVHEILKTMKTTSMKTVGAIFSAGILLTSCVSSKKYHRSQDEVTKLRQDSTMLAQQSSSLQQNLTAEQQKAADLQKSVEAANSTSAGLQKNLAYYSDYVGKEKSSVDQMKGELTTTLVSAGLTDQDITQTDAKIYLNLVEKNLFKGNSTTLSAKGKSIVNSIGQYVKGREGVDVSVADLELANGGAAGTTAMESNSTTTTTTTTGNAGNNDMASSSGTTTRTKAHSATKRHSNSAPMASSSRKRTQVGSGESKSVTYSSGHKSSAMSSARARRAIAWQRQNAVANAFLQNGLPKVKLVAQNQAYGEGNASAQKGVQVVLTPDMDTFYKNMSEGPSGQPVGKNP